MEHIQDLMADVAALWGWPLSDLERLTLWETLDWRARAIERRSWPLPVIWVRG